MREARKAQLVEMQVRGVSGALRRYSPGCFLLESTAPQYRSDGMIYIIEMNYCEMTELQSSALRY